MFEARLLRSWEEPSLELGRAFFGVGKSHISSWKEPLLKLERATSRPQKSLIPTAEEAYLRLVTTSLTTHRCHTYDASGCH